MVLIIFVSTHAGQRSPANTAQVTYRTATALQRKGVSSAPVVHSRPVVTQPLHSQPPTSTTQLTQLSYPVPDISTPVPNPPTPDLPAYFLRSLSALVSRMQFARTHGKTFKDSRRDLYTSLGWPETLTTADYRDVFERDGIAARLVRFFPQMIWSEGYQLVEDPDPGESTAFESDAQDIYDKHNLPSLFRRAHTLAGLAHYSVILIGAGGPWDSPLPQLTNPDSIAFFKLFGEGQANTAGTVEIYDADLVTNEADPRYGLPEFYTLHPNLGNNRTTSRKVHWTRIIHFAQDILDDELYGAPYLRDVFNRLINLDKVEGGGAEGAWLNIVQKTLFDIDKDIKWGRTTAEIATAKQDFKDQMEEFMHDMRNFAFGRGVTPHTLPVTVTEYDKNVVSEMQLIGGSKGIPLRVLIGSLSGQRASDQDIKELNSEMSRQRKHTAEPVLRQFYTRLIDHGALPEPDSYEIVWPDADQMDEVDKYAAAADIADANAKQDAAGDTIILTSDEIRQRVFDLGPLADAVDPDSPLLLDDTNDNSTDDNTDAQDTQTQVDNPVAQTDATQQDSSPTVNTAPRNNLHVYFDTTDRNAQEPEWRVVHRVADAHRDALAALIVDAYAAVADEIDYAELEVALSSGNQLLAHAAIFRPLDEINTSLRTTLQARYLNVMSDGGAAALRSVKARGSFLRNNKQTAHYADPQPQARPSIFVDNGLRSNATISIQFNAVSSRAVEWVSTQSGILIRNIDNATRHAVRQIVANGIIEGLTTRQMAAVVGNTVGLLPRNITTLTGYVSELLDKGIDGQRLQRALIRRANQMRRARGLAIGHDIAITGANRGQQELWLQARDAGQLPMSVRRVWILTPDNRNEDCPICPPMDGQIRGLEEQFTTGDGRQIDGPTAHPACRCGVGIASDDDIKRAERSAT